VEVAFATPDGQPPQADPYGLEPRFHYPDTDEDFMGQVIRTFHTDIDDIRVTLHHMTRLDLIASRRIFQALTEAGLDNDSAWTAVTQAAKTAWRQDRSLVEVLSAEATVTDKVSAAQLKALAEAVQADSAAEAKQVADTLASLEGLQNPLNLSQMTEADILSYDAVFFPGGHGPMVDLYNNADVGRTLQVMHSREKTISALCHGPAALLAAQEGPEGVWLFDGYKIAAFTDEEEDQTKYGKLGMPWYLESALKTRGVVFDDGDAEWVSHVVVDRNVITGQNPGSSEATAEAILKRLGVL
jgi:putative intracellular protease/amidase